MSKVVFRHEQNCPFTAASCTSSGHESTTLLAKTISARTRGDCAAEQPICLVKLQVCFVYVITYHLKE
jgi:hypothetical protein